MNNTATTLALAINLVLTSNSLQARSLPANYDVLAEAPPIARNLASIAAKNATLIDSHHALQFDDATQLPTFLWAAVNQNTARAALKNPSHVTIEQTARQQFERYASVYQLDKMAQASAKLEQIQLLADNSGYIVRFGQQVNGIEVVTKRLNLLLNSSLQLSAISGQLAPQVAIARAKAGFHWNATQAIATAFHDLHHETITAKQWALTKQRGVYRWYTVNSVPKGVTYSLHKPVRVKKVFYPLGTGLEPAYYLELSTVTGNERADYAYVISAKNGALLLRTNLKHSEAAPLFSYRVWADSSNLLPYDSPYGNALTPLLSDHVSRTLSPVVPQLITLSCGPISTCDSWLAAGATKTSGNNVKVYADLSAKDGFGKGDLMGKVSAAATFDYDYKFTVPDDAQHSKQLQAAITQAFYTTNFMHDWLYDHGFDEISGNGQKDNFYRGGLGNDPMQVEVNDYNGTNNANMSTPLDGEAPVMQLFPWLHSIKKLTVNIDSKKHHYEVTIAYFGAKRFNFSGKKIVLVDDGSTIAADGSAGTLSDACEAPFINAEALAGNIALIDRGTCFFSEKAKNAQDAGAIAVLIANNKAGAMVAMGGSGDDTLDQTVTLPVLGVNHGVGTAIKQALAESTVSATLTRKELPPYNSALDNSIVIHEWCHFLSQRLVWLNNNQGWSLGEGWSDFLALVALVKESDRNIVGNEQFQAPYAVAQYAASAQLYEYPLGIRRYPYSTALSKNPLTFKHISNGVALPANITAAPYTDMTGSQNAEVHASGEVWTAMLWDAYTALLNDSTRLRFDQAQQRMLDYLVASLKMTPANPTFLEARDALLVVVKARDTADYKLFWQAFAKRGAGLNAKAPKHYSVTHKNVVEDYSTPFD